MIDPALKSYAEVLAPSCGHELLKAEEHFRDARYTECVMRLGRACEAGLYASATLLGVKIVARSVEQLRTLILRLVEIERNLLKTGDLDFVRRNLPAAAKMLSVAIVDLCSQDEARLGQPDESVRPHSNKVLFDEIHRSLGEKNQFQSRRFTRIRDDLENFQRVRNRAAHALPDGSLSESDENQASEAAAFLNEFLGSVFEAVLADQARQRYAKAA